jgi:hypothetical protein
VDLKTGVCGEVCIYNFMYKIAVCVFH